MTLSVAALSLFLIGMRPSSAQDMVPDFSDQGLERRRKDLDDVFEILSRQVERDFGEEASFEAQLKAERLYFEKLLIEKRKDFLEQLKRVDPSRREEAFAHFTQQQGLIRERFLKHQDEKRRSFNSQDQRRTRRRQRAVVGDYDNA